jgi:hypothetical protein
MGNSSVQAEAPAENHQPIQDDDDLYIDPRLAQDNRGSDRRVEAKASICGQPRATSSVGAGSAYNTAQWRMPPPPSAHRPARASPNLDHGAS